MASGGARQGTPGTAYPNRTDMAANRQPIQAPSGQPYGQRKMQEDAQRAVPLPQGPKPIPLNAPSQRPQEPVTAGLPFGPGPGPDVLNLAPAADDIDAQLAALYRVSGDDGIRRLIELRQAGM